MVTAEGARNKNRPQRRSGRFTGHEIPERLPAGLKRAILLLGALFGLAAAPAGTAAAGCQTVPLLSFGTVSALAPTACADPQPGNVPATTPSGSGLMPLPDIPASGPMTSFQVELAPQVDAQLGDQALAALTTAAAVDAARLGIREVPGSVTVKIGQLDNQLAGDTQAEWYLGDDGRPVVTSITIWLNTRQIDTPQKLEFVAGHEYVHALHQSLGLVQLPVQVKEGLAYWVEYTNVYPGEGSAPSLDAWREDLPASWSFFRTLALTGRASNGSMEIKDDGGTQMGALTTGYLLNRIGAHRWLQILLAASQGTGSVDDLLAQYGGGTWGQAEAAVRSILSQPDGGAGQFAQLARTPQI